MRTKGTGHDETKRALLDIARKQAAKDGLAGLSVRRIARLAGFSAPSLYEYFDSKQAIIEAIAAEIAGSLRLALARAAEATREPRGRLVAIGLAYVAWARRHPQDFMLLFARMPSKRRSLAAPTPPGSPYQVVRAAVDEAIATGAIAVGRDTAEHTAYALWAAAHGMAMLQLTHLAGFDAPFEQVDRATLTALVDGLAAA
jgi:AcrR family transcriptional regulator